MAKLPFMQFYPNDWMRDTIPLSAAARGVWIDLLCFLWNYPTRGTATRPLNGWAAQLRLAPPDFDQILTELQTHEIADIVYVSPSVPDMSTLITISSRRMLRDEKTREYERLKKRGQRKPQPNDSCPDAVPSSSPRIYQKSEVRSQKSEEEKKEGSAEGRLVVAKVNGTPLKRRCVFPDEFKYTDDHGELAKQLGLNVAVEFAHFRDNHKAKGTVFVDWGRAFNTWLRRANQYRRV